MLLNSKNKKYAAKMRPHILKPTINYFENVCKVLEVWYHYPHALVKSNIPIWKYYYVCVTCTCINNIWLPYIRSKCLTAAFQQGPFLSILNLSKKELFYLG